MYVYSLAFLANASTPVAKSDFLLSMLCLILMILWALRLLESPHPHMALPIPGAVLMVTMMTTLVLLVRPIYCVVILMKRLRLLESPHLHMV